MMEDRGERKDCIIGRIERGQRTRRASNWCRLKVFEVDKRPIFTSVFRLRPISLPLSGHITKCHVYMMQRLVCASVLCLCV